LTSLLAWTLGRGSRAIGIVLVVAMSFPAAGALSVELIGARAKRDVASGLSAWLRAAGGGKPVLMCEPLEALRQAELAGDGPPPVIFCQADKGLDSPDRSLLALRGRVPLQMLTLEECFRAFEGHLLLDQSEGRSECFSTGKQIPSYRAVPTAQQHHGRRLYRVEPYDHGQFLIFADDFESGSLDRWQR
jgi:hypothetical protein